MEFLEEERRPRFLFQAGRSAGVFAASAAIEEDPKLDKFHAAACLSASAALLFLAYLSLSGTQTLASLLLWAAFSLALGAFSPPSSTGGDCRVGRGDPLPDPEPAPDHSDLDDPKKRIQGRRARSKKPEDPPPPPLVPVVSAMAKIKDPILDNDSGSADHVKSEQNEEEKEWTVEDYELLKRQISKHPVGEPRRWERIAEAFRGQHGLDSVITTAKSLSEKRPASGDSYQQFLKQRKPVDKRVVAAELELPLQVGENGDSTKENGGGAEKWSSGEDIALLNALKTFPKDVSMRWEKVAAAVPGKSKVACMKRVAELKRNFRTSKVTDA
ncbi:transcription factor MAMYB-like [Zingiber officinale]|uniref:transcription factor MAMYB-like n=1 Tax=Zingiber officinale TaxID=94328 RepID=UPI001C4AB69C|nr:transcription factor MAMYB-like [Zingiber officinale]XP_042391381.1 transcription factor MAMYB-like [Zingiber officinale]